MKKECQIALSVLIIPLFGFFFKTVLPKYCLYKRKKISFGLQMAYLSHLKTAWKFLPRLLMSELFSALRVLEQKEAIDRSQRRPEQ